LNTQTREISPVRGNHATKVTRTERACAGIPRRVRCLGRHLAWAPLRRQVRDIFRTAGYSRGCRSRRPQALPGAQRPGRADRSATFREERDDARAQAPADMAGKVIVRTTACCHARTGRAVPGHSRRPSASRRPDLPMRAHCTSAFRMTGSHSVMQTEFTGHEPHIRRGRSAGQRPTDSTNRFGANLEAQLAQPGKAMADARFRSGIVH
jgi:hypothetical protein